MTVSRDEKNRKNLINLRAYSVGHKFQRGEWVSSKAARISSSSNGDCCREGENAYTLQELPQQLET